MAILLHPTINDGIKQGAEGFSGGTLVCRCAGNPVKVTVGSNVMHNHACGCTKCWKPEGAVFSVVGVVPRDKVRVTENGNKLAIVDPTMTIQRHACKACGVHMYGRIENESHAFHGLDFIHAELFEEAGSAAPGFAAFVSSIIESGFAPEGMSEVRAQIESIGLQPYDCLNPTLMDVLATHAYKQAHAN
jgi:S-(hydroxymethyl)glutathione synthase